MREGRPSGGEGQSGFNRGEKGGSVNVANVILTYTGIMAVFVIAAYYLKKWSLYRKKKTVANPN
ncbi:hypothetical protein D3C75_1207770 [compost metagenome]